MKDRNAVNHNIRKHFNELIYNTARYTEIALSIVIIIVIALSGLRLILTNLALLFVTAFKTSIKSCGKSILLFSFMQNTIPFVHSFLVFLLNSYLHIRTHM